MKISAEQKGQRLHITLQDAEGQVSGRYSVRHKDSTHDLVSGRSFLGRTIIANIAGCRKGSHVVKVFVREGEELPDTPITCEVELDPNLHLD